MNEKRRRANALMMKYYSGMIDEGGWKHASGNIAVFNTKYRRDLKSLVVQLDPIQAGSGDPSPDNVRPISGRTDANIYLEHSYDAQAAPVKTISWQADAGTVYGGTVDVVSGQLTVNKILITRNTAEMNNTEPYAGWRDSLWLDLFGADINNRYLDQLLNVGTVFSVNTKNVPAVLYLPQIIYGLTQTDWKALAINVQIIITLLQPQIYQLTPQQIQTLIGENVIWSDAGPVSVEYWS